MASFKHLAIVTSGGDAPGTNAAIRAAARVALEAGVRVSGVRRSWLGVQSGELVELTRARLAGVVRQGGTILNSARTRLLMEPGDGERIASRLADQGVDCVLVIGGDGSHKGALALSEAGFPVVGVPKTIDNDISGTDVSIGFQTAVETATQAIDRIRTHTESNDRVMVVEVMGRHAGWIATWAGIASGADLVLIPEFPWNLETVHQHLKKRHEADHRDFSLIVIAEGATDTDGSIKVEARRTDHLGRPFLEGIGELLAWEVEQQLGFECRCTTLGYLLRGGTPVAADRLLATRLASNAVDCLLEGVSGVMVGSLHGSVARTPLAQVAGIAKPVDAATYRLAQRFF